MSSHIVGFFRGFLVYVCIVDLWERSECLWEIVTPSVYVTGLQYVLFGVWSDCSISSSKTVFVVLIWS